MTEGSLKGLLRWLTRVQVGSGCVSVGPLQDLGTNASKEHIRAPPAKDHDIGCGNAVDEERHLLLVLLQLCSSARC
jgi:hypothetical protein